MGPLGSTFSRPGGGGVQTQPLAGGCTAPTRRQVRAFTCVQVFSWRLSVAGRLIVSLRTCASLVFRSRGHRLDGIPIALLFAMRSVSVSFDRGRPFDILSVKGCGRRNGNFFAQWLTKRLRFRASTDRRRSEPVSSLVVAARSMPPPMPLGQALAAYAINHPRGSDLYAIEVRSVFCHKEDATF